MTAFAKRDYVNLRRGVWPQRLRPMEWTELFEGFTVKADIVVENMPCTCFNPFVYSVQQEAAWPKLGGRSIKEHVDNNRE